MRSVNSHAQGAQKYSRLVNRKNASTQTWSEDKAGYTCMCVSLCVDGHREGNTSHRGDSAELVFNVKQVCSSRQDSEISFG